MSKSFPYLKVFLTVILIFQLSANALQAKSAESDIQKIDPLTESATVSKNFIKEKAIEEGKELNVNAYENALEKANSGAEKEKLYKELDEYVVYSEVEYLNTDGSTNGGVSILASPGDSRITTSYVYGQQTTYANQSGKLSDMTSKSITLGFSYTHPYVSTFMSILDVFIPSVQYASYNSTIISTIHDYVIIRKAVEIYQWNGTQYIWAPMATSEKKNTSAQLNTVYYKGSVRYTPSNLDLGQIAGQAGTYFYDEARLVSLAKSALSPLYYYYTSGSVVGIDPSSKFKY
ncbi:hypothetical protein [Paenibacillus medicaginis]|uniref:Uncharacterized protein n=1 Tax=Paenibacillus medicaginis TaxID=1470560 RepID=A0ABV5C1T4_9BACL